MYCISINVCTATFAQDNSNTKDTFVRDGFMFEFGLGGGIISMKDSAGTSAFNDSQGVTIPELKFGH